MQLSKAGLKVARLLGTAHLSFSLTFYPHQLAIMAVLLFITLSLYQFSLPSIASLSLLLSSIQLLLDLMFTINRGNRHQNHKEYK